MSNQRLKITDQLLAILLVLVMIMGMLPTSIYASTAEFPDQFTVTVKDSDGVPVPDASVTYTVSVGGVPEETNQTAQEPTNSNGVAAIELASYASDLSNGAEVSISVTVTKEPAYFEKTVTAIPVTSITGNLDVTLESKTCVITFIPNEFGKFTRLDSEEAISELTVNRNENVSFRFIPLIPLNGFEVAVADGESPLEAVDGVYTISNVQGSHTVTATITDVQEPKIEAITVENEADWSKEKSIDVTVSDNAEADLVRVFISKTEYADYSELIAAGETAVALPYKVSENGIYYVYAVDAGNNFVKDSIEVTKIDTEAPSISGFTPVPAGFSDAPQYKFTVTDPLSGVASVQYYKAGTPTLLHNAEKDGEEYYFVAGANAEYFVVATDHAGNSATSSTTVRNYDGDAPSITAVNVAAQWNSSGNEVTFTVADNSSIKALFFAKTETPYETVEALEGASDVTEIAVKSENHGNGTYTFTATENGLYYIYAVDDFDHLAHAQATVDHIDTTAPTVDTVQKDPDKQWHNDEIRISATASDRQETGDAAGSGVDFVVYSTSETGYDDGDYKKAVQDGQNYSFVIPKEEFSGTYYLWAVDGVGRVSEQPEQIDVNIDLTNPSITGMNYVEDTDHGFVARIFNVLTFGLVFKDQIYIDVQANDNQTPHSGIAKYEYKLVPDGVEEEEIEWVAYELPDKVEDGKEAENVRIQLDVEQYASFKGKVNVRVWDNAENVSMAYTYIDPENGDVDIYFEQEGKTVPTAPQIEINGEKIPSNDPYEMEWAKDAVICASGSIATSGIREYQYRMEYKDPDLQGVDWTTMPESTEQIDSETQGVTIPNQIMIQEDTYAIYYFRAISNAGIAGEEVSVVVKIQKTLPSNAKVEIPEANGKNGWHVGYDKNNPLTVEITEPDVSDYVAPVTTYYKLWNSTTEEEPDDGTEFNGNNPPVIAADGEYKLKVWTVDAAGNECEGIGEITPINVDSTPPKDLTLKINDDIVTAENSVAFDKFFYKDPVTVIISANCDVSGQASLQYQKVHAVSEYDVDGTWINYPSGGIVVEPNEKFILYCRVEDRAGNVTFGNSTGIIVDDKLPEGKVNAPEIDIFPAAPNANGFHNGDVSVDLAVIDPLGQGQTGDHSGLNLVTYRIYTTDTGAVEEGTLFDVANGVNKGDVRRDADGLVDSWSGSITVSGSSFNSNNVRVEVTAIDNAGNARTTTTAEGEIKIDMTRPAIGVTYSNNAADSGFYFKADRTATVVITERNFDPKDVTVRITNTDGVIPRVTSWRQTSGGTGNRDNATWAATITYAADGDYTFDISYTDLADNRMSGVSYGNSVAPTKFTVDKTLPTITVSYDNNAAKNEKYFNAPRTATVTINEHNFDARRVEFTRTVDGEPDTPNVSWSNRGNIHTATIPYTNDGDYTFAVKMLDLAGNRCNDANYGNSVAAEDFTVDQKIDRIEIGGIIDGHAYKDDVKPKVSFVDINYDSYELKLTRTRKDEIEADVTDQFMGEMEDVTEPGVEEKTFDTFSHIKENDGIYTLKVSVTDKAGNEETESTTFTVNRFGSVYVYNDTLCALIKDGGQYVTGVDGPLVITEYNASKLKNDSLDIEVTLDGRSMEAEYVADPVPSQTAKVGSSGWYQYQYTIGPENFAADGVYQIALSSLDAAGNTPESVPYSLSEDGKPDDASSGNSTDESGKEIVDTMLFRVDSTSPELPRIAGLEKSRINAQTVTVNYNAYDAIGLKSIEVSLDDKPVQTITEFEDINNYSGNFEINESSDSQNVCIVVTDLAGNMINTDTVEDFPYAFNKSVTVSTSVLVLWYANKPLFWGSIGGAIILAALIWLAIVALKKKKQKVTS